MKSLMGVRTGLPAGGAVGSLVLGAAAVSALLGSGTAGVVSVGASVLVPVVPLVVALFFLRWKRDLSLSMTSRAVDEMNE